MLKGPFARKKSIMKIAINGRNRTYFCGAYWGQGFHEDGVNSALAVGQCFGKRLESCTVACIKGMSNTGG